MLNQHDQLRAKRLYAEFFRRHPLIKNPTDINCKEKFDYAMEIGWEGLQLMQTARKDNVKRYGYPFPWTKGPTA